MAFSPHSSDRNFAGFAPGPGIVRPDLKFGAARTREALAPEICHTEFVSNFPNTCCEHAHSDHSGRVPSVAALAVERVET